ncbi:MAG: DUF4350 domain-containing protein [Candidatus Odinarchaeia archaeon]
MSLVGVGNTTLSDYSIYNTNWNGLSSFRNLAESNGYEVKPVISSLSSINRVNTPSGLFIIGPIAFYDPLSSSALLDYLNQGGNVVIADDFGSSAELLIFLGSPVSFSGVLLLDAGSYDKNISLPIITSLGAHPIFEGVNSLEFNYASSISGTGGTVLAYSSTMSWLDANANYRYDDGESVGPFPVIINFNVGNGSVILISDPTLFNNDMINRADNLQFALNLINWVAGGDTSTLIIMDEGHRADITNPQFFFGAILGEINWVSSHWLLAPLFPIIAILLIRSWLPSKKKHVSTEISEKPRKSMFTTKLRWYTSSQNYNKAIKTLVNKLKRDIISMYHLNTFEITQVASVISKANPDIKEKEIIGIFNTFDIVGKGDKIISDKDLFLKIYSEINRFRDMVGLGK